MNNTHQQPCTADAGAAQTASLPAEGSAAGDQGLPAYQQIKLALDVHAATIVVVRMLDGAKPQPPQTMKPADFLAWVQKQKAQAREVVSCYLPAAGKRSRADRLLAPPPAQRAGRAQLRRLPHPAG